MKIALARFLLAFLLVWLPLQAYAAGSMSYCQRHHEHATAPATAEPAPHMDCHAQPAADLSSQSLPGCDDCSSCHLFAQPALAVDVLTLQIDVVRTHQAPPASSFALFFPEQPQRPPLAFPS